MCSGSYGYRFIWLYKNFDMVEMKGLKREY